jgi:hypothetical protein
MGPSAGPDEKNFGPAGTKTPSAYSGFTQVRGLSWPTEPDTIPHTVQALGWAAGESKSAGCGALPASMRGLGGGMIPCSTAP